MGIGCVSEVYLDYGKEYMRGVCVWCGVHVCVYVCVYVWVGVFVCLFER